MRQRLHLTCNITDLAEETKRDSPQSRLQSRPLLSISIYLGESLPMEHRADSGGGATSAFRATTIICCGNFPASFDEQLAGGFSLPARSATAPFGAQSECALLSALRLKRALQSRSIVEGGMVKNPGRRRCASWPQADAGHEGAIVLVEVRGQVEQDGAASNVDGELGFVIRRDANDERGFFIG
jgi:hypothetical protein